MNEITRCADICLRRLLEREILSYGKSYDERYRRCSQYIQSYRQQGI